MNLQFQLTISLWSQLWSIAIIESLLISYRTANANFRSKISRIRKSLNTNSLSALRKQMPLLLSFSLVLSSITFTVTKMTTITKSVKVCLVSNGENHTTTARGVNCPQLSCDFSEDPNCSFPSSSVISW